MQIRGAMEDWATAIRGKNADGVFRHYAPDVVIFDLAPPLRTTGGNRKSLEAWFDTWRGPIDYEVTELSITVGGSLAFARSLHRIGGTKADGETPSTWARATTCFAKIRGEWKVVHDHSSVPMYMDGSGRAAADLEP